MTAQVLMTMMVMVIMVMVACTCSSAQVTTFDAPLYITTIAGTGNNGYNGEGMLATDANLNYPSGVAVNTLGEVFFADSNNQRVRKILLDGTITTIAGTGVIGYNGDDILAKDAQLSYPTEVTVNSMGEVLIADYTNHRIRKILLNGTIITIADAQLSYPSEVKVNSLGEILISDPGNYRIRKILLNGSITTIAGTGNYGYNGDGILATEADLNGAYGVAVNSLGEIVIADCDNHRIRKILLNGTITTIAGTGVGGYNGDGILATDADLYYPSGVAVNSLGEVLIADLENHRVRKILLNGTIITIAGTGVGGYNGEGILATDANLYYPDLALNSLTEEVLIVETNAHRIRILSGVCPPNSIKSLQQCNCMTGYFGYGQYCDKYNCSNIVNDRSDVCSSNGKCVSPNNCTCTAGYYGTDCEQFDCYGIPKTNTNVCSGSGQCTGLNNCTCNAGYFGTNCELYNCNNILFNDSSVCTPFSSCIAPNNCSCNAGYFGTDCEIYNCNNILFNDSSVCSSLGSCSGPNNCSCNAGYFGTICELYNCNNILFNDTSVCSSFGSCIAPNNCTCNAGYYGTGCEQFDCYGTPKTNTSGVCSGSGQCTGYNICTCNSGWNGTNCEIPLCDGIQSGDARVCSGHGSCDSKDLCNCSQGWGSTFCNVPICNGTLATQTNTVCGGHGYCSSPDVCNCTNNNYGGQFCTIPICNGTLANSEGVVCNGHGSCNSDAKCECTDGNWGGQFCEIPKCNGILANNQSIVCNGHGSCVHSNQCVCSSGYGPSGECKYAICYGILASNPSVCSNGNGICSTVDTCVCKNGFVGNECSLYYINSDTVSVSFNSTQDYVLESSTTVRIIITHAQFTSFYNTKSITARCTYTLDSGSPVVISVVLPAISSSTLETAVPPFKTVGKVSVSVQLIDTESGIVISDNVQSTNTLSIINRSRVGSASQSSYFIGLLVCLVISFVGLF